MRGEMGPVFEQVLGQVVAAVKSEKGIIKVKEEKAQDQFSLGSSDSDSEQEEGMDVLMDFIDEKASAVHALGYLCLFCPALALPHLHQILETLADVSFYFHENIRYHVA
mmetsp:Transcript_5131/g.3816  ORF Transcript_5131/g.3816 Transcript_5131/m.3816 type:complete len:109 (-) Transcript_5131:256-582(-)